MALNKTRLLNEHYIKALEKKANRFLDKNSIRKEKNKIKTQYRDQALLCNISDQGKPMGIKSTKSEHVLSSDCNYADSQSDSERF